MDKMRVYELAKALSVSSSDLIGCLDSLGVEVTSAANSITRDQISRVISLFATNGSPVPQELLTSLGQTQNSISTATRLTKTAKSFHVDPENLSDFLDRAREGDVLILETGDYKGPFSIDKPLTLRGEGHDTVLFAGNEPAVMVSAPGVRFESLSIERTDGGDRGETALEFDPGCEPVLCDVWLTGAAPGARFENATWDLPPSLDLHQLEIGRTHETEISITVAADCRISTAIPSLLATPAVLSPGPAILRVIVRGADAIPGSRMASEIILTENNGKQHSIKVTAAFVSTAPLFMDNDEVEQEEEEDEWFQDVEWGVSFERQAAQRFLSKFGRVDAQYGDFRDDAVEFLQEIGEYGACLYYLRKRGQGKKAGQERWELTIATDNPDFPLPPLLAERNCTLKLAGVVDDGGDDSGLFVLDAAAVDVRRGCRDGFALPLLISFDSFYESHSTLPDESLESIRELPDYSECLPTVDQLVIWESHVKIERAIARAKQFCVSYSRRNLDSHSTHISFKLDPESALLSYADSESLAIDEFWRRATGARNDFIKLVDEDEYVEDRRESTQILGRIEKLDKNNASLLVKLDEDLLEQLESGYFTLPKTGWLLFDAYGNITEVNRKEQALRDLREGRARNPYLGSFFFDSCQARLPEYVPGIEDYELLNPERVNDEQRLTVEKVMASPDLTLVQGPPGTGKTTVIAEICYQVARRGGKTLIASQTNLAVDNAMSRLVHHPIIRALRKGKANKVEDEGKPYLENRVIGTWLGSTSDHCELELNRRKESIELFGNLLSDENRLIRYIDIEEQYVSKQEWYRRRLLIQRFKQIVFEFCNKRDSTDLAANRDLQKNLDTCLNTQICWSDSPLLTLQEQCLTTVLDHPDVQFFKRTLDGLDSVFSQMNIVVPELPSLALFARHEALREKAGLVADEKNTTLSVIEQAICHLEGLQQQLLHVSTVEAELESVNMQLTEMQQKFVEADKKYSQIVRERDELHKACRVTSSLLEDKQTNLKLIELAISHVETVRNQRLHIETTEAELESAKRHYAKMKKVAGESTTSHSLLGNELEELNRICLVTSSLFEERQSKLAMTEMAIHHVETIRKQLLDITTIEKELSSAERRHEELLQAKDAADARHTTLNNERDKLRNASRVISSFVNQPGGADWQHPDAVTLQREYGTYIEEYEGFPLFQKHLKTVIASLGRLGIHVPQGPVLTCAENCRTLVAPWREKFGDIETRNEHQNIISIKAQKIVGRFEELQQQLAEQSGALKISAEQERALVGKSDFFGNFKTLMLTSGTDYRQWLGTLQSHVTQFNDSWILENYQSNDTSVPKLPLTVQQAIEKVGRNKVPWLAAHDRLVELVDTMLPLVGSRLSTLGSLNDIRVLLDEGLRITGKRKNSSVYKSDVVPDIVELNKLVTTLIINIRKPLSVADKVIDTFGDCARRIEERKKLVLYREWLNILLADIPPSPTSEELQRISAQYVSDLTLQGEKWFENANRYCSSKQTEFLSELETVRLRCAELENSCGNIREELAGLESRSREVYEQIGISINEFSERGITITLPRLNSYGRISDLALYVHQFINEFSGWSEEIKLILSASEKINSSAFMKSIVQKLNTDVAEINSSLADLEDAMNATLERLSDAEATVDSIRETLGSLKIAWDGNPLRQLCSAAPFDTLTGQNRLRKIIAPPVENLLDAEKMCKKLADFKRGISGVSDVVVLLENQLCFSFAWADEVRFILSNPENHNSITLLKSVLNKINDCIERMESAVAAQKDKMNDALSAVFEADSAVESVQKTLDSLKIAWERNPLRELTLLPPFNALAESDRFRKKVASKIETLVDAEKMHKNLTYSKRELLDVAYVIVSLEKQLNLSFAWADEVNLLLANPGSTDSLILLKSIQQKLNDCTSDMDSVVTAQEEKKNAAHAALAVVEAAVISVNEVLDGLNVSWEQNQLRQLSNSAPFNALVMQKRIGKKAAVVIDNLVQIKKLHKILTDFRQEISGDMILLEEHLNLVMSLNVNIIIDIVGASLFSCEQELVHLITSRSEQLDTQLPAAILEIETMLIKLDAALHEERTWWSQTWKAVPERLRSQFSDGDIYAPVFLHQIVDCFSDWRYELEKENAYLERYEILVSDWIDRLRTPSERDANDLRSIYIANANVIGITCSQAATSHFNREFPEFDVVIIDEVSKCTPPELMMPALKGKKVVLVGDHRQLPPMFEDKTINELAEDLGIAVHELSFIKTSMFKSLYNRADDSIKQDLRRQYRMHPAIMGAINQFYDGRLKCGIPDPEISRAHGLAGPVLRENHHIVWISTPLNEENQELKDGTSAYNTSEIDIIEQLCRQMDSSWAPHVANGEKPKEVAVITFYLAQLKRIQDRIRDIDYPNLKIRRGSVDRFQGMERPVVIVSMVRNNSHGDVGFAREPERVNVAFSRAQELLVIVGCRDLFVNNARHSRQIYQDVSNHIRRHGGLVDVSSFAR